VLDTIKSMKVGSSEINKEKRLSKREVLGRLGGGKWEERGLSSLCDSLKNTKAKNVFNLNWEKLKKDKKE